MNVGKYLLISFFFAGIFSFHKYFFAFAEIEYKEKEKKLETTLIFTTHDLEQSLIKKGIIGGEFENVSHDSLQLKKIQDYLLLDFSISTNSQQLKFNLLDFELKKNGLINLYLEANEIEQFKELEIKFMSLMNDFPNQQNKVTFIHGGQKQTAVFLKNKPIQKISLL